MDAKNVSEIIMNDDSEFSDFSDSSDEEYDDLDLCDSSDSDSSTDTIRVPMQSPVEQPGPSQLRAMRRNYVWQTANRQPQVAVFSGRQGPTNEVNVSDVDCPHEYFKLIFDDTFIRKLENIALYALSQQHTARTYKRKLSALQT